LPPSIHQSAGAICIRAANEKLRLKEKKKRASTSAARRYLSSRTDLSRPRENRRKSSRADARSISRGGRLGGRRGYRFAPVDSGSGRKFQRGNNHFYSRFESAPEEGKRRRRERYGVDIRFGGGDGAKSINRIIARRERRRAPPPSSSIPHARPIINRGGAIMPRRIRAASARMRGCAALALFDVDGPCCSAESAACRLPPPPLSLSLSLSGPLRMLAAYFSFRVCKCIRLSGAGLCSRCTGTCIHLHVYTRGV